MNALAIKISALKYHLLMLVLLNKKIKNKKKTCLKVCLTLSFSRVIFYLRKLPQFILHSAVKNGQIKIFLCVNKKE